MCKYAYRMNKLFTTIVVTTLLLTSFLAYAESVEWKIVTIKNSLGKVDRTAAIKSCKASDILRSVSGVQNGASDPEVKVTRIEFLEKDGFSAVKVGIQYMHTVGDSRTKSFTITDRQLGSRRANFDTKMFICGIIIHGWSEKDRTVEIEFRRAPNPFG